MPCISEKQNMEKYYIEVIVDIHVNSIYFWLNEKHIETKFIQIYQFLQINMTQCIQNIDLNW